MHKRECANNFTILKYQSTKTAVLCLNWDSFWKIYSSIFIFGKRHWFSVPSNAAGWLTWLPMIQKMKAYHFRLGFLMLSVALTFLIVQQTSACVPKECHWDYCSESWSGWSSNNPGSGQCVQQYNRVSYHHETYYRSSGCPSDTKCYSGDKSRIMCNYFLILFQVLCIIAVFSNQLPSVISNFTNG